MRFKFLQKFEQKIRTVESFRALLKGSADLRSQGYQDMFALVASNFKRNGFFVEFGATDGRHLSNTWVLEKNFGWDGILAEPGLIWHDKLRANRQCRISTECVWTVSGETLTFLEAADPFLSTISSFANSDGRDRMNRGQSSSYKVRTISLNDLLQAHDAPASIDFMSIDTEGSEFDILSHFDLDRYSVNALCVEHNYTDARQKIFRLLSDKGYRQVFKGISGSDDWYQKIRP